MPNACSNAGYTVTIIDNLSTGRIENIQALEGNPHFHSAIEDIRNVHVMDRLVSECDVIFHLAAAVGVQRIISEPIETIETNIGGTEVVLKTARRYRKKVLIASTSEVYGKGVRFPFHEDDNSVLGPTTRSRWSYATSKAIDEFLALAYHKEANLPVVIFRLFNTVGPRQSGQYGMVLPRFVNWALKGEPIMVYGDGQQQRCFCNVRDVVRGDPRTERKPGGDWAGVQHRQHRRNHDCRACRARARACGQRFGNSAASRTRKPTKRVLRIFGGACPHWIKFGIQSNGSQRHRWTKPSSR